MIDKILAKITLLEILIGVGAGLGITLLSLLLINPTGRINQEIDSTRMMEVQTIDAAISKYMQINQEGFPTYADGKALPTITQSSIITDGVSVANLDSFASEYLTAAPQDPTGKEYKVGILSGGTLVVGIELSNSEIFTSND